MSVLLDGVIAVSMIVDMIESFTKKGIKIELANIDDEIKRRDECRKSVNKQLGIES